VALPAATTESQVLEDMQHEHHLVAEKAGGHGGDDQRHPERVS
jgi:hypothetical protein